MIITDKEIRDASTGELIGGKIIGYKDFDVDGIKVSIELREDAYGREPFLFYPNFAENKVYTPEGRPLTLAVEDKCQYAEQLDEEPCIDCTGCEFYRPVAPKILFGVCMNDKNKKDS